MSKKIDLKKVFKDSSQVYDLDLNCILFSKSSCNFMPVSYDDKRLFNLYCKSKYGCEAELLTETIKFCINNMKKGGKKYCDIDNHKNILAKDKYKYVIDGPEFRIVTNNLNLSLDIVDMIIYYYNSNDPKINIASEFVIIPTDSVSSAKLGPELRSKAKRTAVPKKMRDDLWDKYYPGVSEGFCICCEDKIQMRRFEAGHVISVCNSGSTTIDNLRPICFGCNRSMSSMNMDLYIKKYYPKNTLFK
jgi:hypothetical protein